MLGYRTLRAAAIALGLYGALGLFIATAMLIVGRSTFDQVATLSATLERERAALVGWISTASVTLKNATSAPATSGPQ